MRTVSVKCEWYGGGLPSTAPLTMGLGWRSSFVYVYILDIPAGVNTLNRSPVHDREFIALAVLFCWLVEFLGFRWFSQVPLGDGGPSSIQITEALDLLQVSLQLGLFGAGWVRAYDRKCRNSIGFQV